MFLKWEDTLLGIIDPSSYVVTIVNPHLNPTVERLFHGKSVLSDQEWYTFLADRIVSKDRRDLDAILYSCGLSRYDVFKLAEYTRAFSPNDKCWIAFNLEEKHQECFREFLQHGPLRKRDTNGNSVYSPGGQQIKKYGFWNDHFGIFKQRLNPLSTDVESEIAVYLLCEKLGVPCCPAIWVDDKTVFSQYLYDFNHDSFIHFRNLFPLEERVDGTVETFLGMRPQYETELFQMLTVDFITHQDDRHPSNYAVKISGDTETFYPLYDNGRSLFYMDSEEMVKQKCTDPVLYCNSFGLSGSQWDALTDLLARNPSLGNSVNLNISDAEITEILQKANITGYRGEGAKVWIRKSLDVLREQVLEHFQAAPDRVHPQLGARISSASHRANKSSNKKEQNTHDTQPER